MSRRSPKTCFLYRAGAGKTTALASVVNPITQARELESEVATRQFAAAIQQACPKVNATVSPEWMRHEKAIRTCLAHTAAQATEPAKAAVAQSRRDFSYGRYLAWQIAGVALALALGFGFLVLMFCLGR